MYFNTGHQAYEPGTEAFQKIVKQFGNNVVSDKGTIDRGVLGPIVFGGKVCFNEALVVYISVT